MPSPYPNTGSLNQPIIVEKLTVTQSPVSGAKTKTWSSFAKLMARVVYGSGAEKEQSSTIIVEEKVVFITRYFSGINETMRILFNGNEFNIRFIEKIGRNRYLKIHSELIKK